MYSLNDPRMSRPEFHIGNQTDRHPRTLPADAACPGPEHQTFGTECRRLQVVTDIAMAATHQYVSMGTHCWDAEFPTDFDEESVEMPGYVDVLMSVPKLDRGHGSPQTRKLGLQFIT